MAAPATIDVDRLVCQDVFTTSRGAKQIPLLHRDGSTVQWQTREALPVLWEPSAFGDPEATRQNISFAPTPEVLTELKRFDDFAIDTLAAESVRLFGSSVDKEEVKRRYQASLRVHEKSGAASLRCKMNTSGRSQVKCWDTFRKPRSQPESWTSCAVTPRITVRGFWVMGKEIGPLFELTHALIDEAVQECPF